MRKHVAVLLLISGLILVPTALIARLAHHWLHVQTDTAQSHWIVIGSAVLALLGLAGALVAAGVLLTWLSGGSFKDPEGESANERFPLLRLCETSEDFAELPDELLECLRHAKQPLLDDSDWEIYKVYLRSLENGPYLPIPKAASPAVRERLLWKVLTVLQENGEPPDILPGGRGEIVRLRIEEKTADDILQSLWQEGPEPANVPACETR